MEKKQEHNIQLCVNDGKLSEVYLGITSMSITKALEQKGRSFSRPAAGESLLTKTVTGN